MNKALSTYSTNINLNTLFIKRTYIFNLFYKSNNYLLFFFYNHIWLFFSPLNIFNNLKNNIFWVDLLMPKSKNIFFSKQVKVQKNSQFLYYNSFRSNTFFYKKLTQYPMINKVSKKQKNLITSYTFHKSFMTFYSKLYQDSKLRILTPMLKAEPFDFLPLPTTPFKSFFKSNNFYKIVNVQKRLKFLNLITGLTKKVKLVSLTQDSVLNLAKFSKATSLADSTKLMHLIPRQTTFLNPKSRVTIIQNKPARDVLLSYVLSTYKKGLDKTEIDTLYPFSTDEHFNDSWNNQLSHTRSLFNNSFIFKRKAHKRSKLEQSSLSTTLDITRLFHYKIDLENRTFLKNQFKQTLNSNLNLRISKVIRRINSTLTSTETIISSQEKIFKKLKKNYKYSNNNYLSIYNLLIKRVSIPTYTALNWSLFTKLTMLKHFNVFKYWSLPARRLYASQALHTSNKQSSVSRKEISNLLKLELKDFKLNNLNVQNGSNSINQLTTTFFNTNSFFIKSLFRVHNNRKLLGQVGISKWTIRHYNNSSKQLTSILNSVNTSKLLNQFAPLSFTIWENFKFLSSTARSTEALNKALRFKKPSKKKLIFHSTTKPFVTINFIKNENVLEKSLYTKTNDVSLSKKKNKITKSKIINTVITDWESELWTSCIYRSFWQNRIKTRRKVRYSCYNTSRLLSYDFGFKFKFMYLVRLFKNLVYKNMHKPLLLTRFWSSLNQVNPLNITRHLITSSLQCSVGSTIGLNYVYLKNLIFVKKVTVDRLSNISLIKPLQKISDTIAESEDYHLFSKYSRAFISSSTGFMFTNANFLYHKQFKLDSLKISHLNRQRYSFFYKNDIKRFYLNRSGNLTFLQNLDKDTFLRNKLLYNRLYLRKNHYTYDSVSSVNTKTIANTAIDPFFKNYNNFRKIINTFSLDDSTFSHQNLTPRLWEPRIKRIRFKPGYQRIWRKAREGINFSLKFNLKYQHRLTHKLAKLRFIKNKCTTRIYDLTLSKILLNTRFVYDLNVSKSLIDNALVYVNGVVTRNPNLLLYVSDFIQIAISIKYYIVYRWLVNWNFNQRARLVKLSFYKNKVKHDLAKQKSNILPDWIFKIGSRQMDVPKYTEVDYFTLSIFIIYEPLSVNEFNPLLFLDDRSYILNMYNWKFIN